MRIAIICPFVLLLISSSLSQIDTTNIAFYPLQLGNYWEYKNQITDWGAPDPLIYIEYYSKEVVNDTVMSNGKKYQVIMRKSIPDTLPVRWYFERVDSLSANVYSYIEYLEDEFLIDSLNAVVGDTCYYSRLNPEDSGYLLTVCQSITSETVLGYTTVQKNYRNQIDFQFGNEYWLAKNIGLSRYETYEIPTNSTHLIYARINEIEYGSPLYLENEIKHLPRFMLSQNFPNPFNPVTTIKYELPFNMNIDLVLYNVLGKRLNILFTGEQTKGIHEIQIDGSNLSSGIYYFQLSGNGLRLSKKCVLIK